MESNLLSFVFINTKVWVRKYWTSVSWFFKLVMEQDFGLKFVANFENWSLIYFRTNFQLLKKKLFKKGTEIKMDGWKETFWCHSIWILKWISKVNSWKTLISKGN